MRLDQTQEPANQPGNLLQDTFMRLEQAEQLRTEGKLDRAQRMCESLLRKHPDYMAALHTLGLVHADRKNYQQALGALHRAVMLNPRSWTTLTALSTVYLELDASEMAAQTLEQARAIKPQDTNVLVTLGEIYRKEREYELAKDAFAQALALEPNFVPAITGYGWACSLLGENEEAVAIFEGLVEGEVRTAEPILALSTLPSSLVNIDLLSQLENISLKPDETSADENLMLFIRAAALDGAGRYEEAWESVLPANRQMLQDMQKDLRDLLDRQRTTIRLLRANRLKVASSNADDDKPISLFILGPSRSGKTTMEQLVATLDDVKRGYENPSVDRAIRRTFQTAGLLASNFFEVLPPQLYPLCREIYLEELARRAGSAKVFTNTHPTRIHDAAPMVTVFPNVRFIFVKRDPDDLALRIFMRRYRTGNAYAYDLTMIRDHINWYHEMIDLMAQKLPDHVRVVHYEDMVTDPAGALRVAADLCGLSWPDGPVPVVGDDRGCAEPYRKLMASSAD